MLFSICLNSRDFSFYLFKLCYVYCISIVCTSCNRCDLTCYIISYIANGYSRCCRFPCGTCISRCCFGADIITSCTGCYSRLRFTAKSYTTFSRYLCIMTNSYCIVHSCSSFCVARTNNDSVISTCYLTVITNNNCIISIRYSVLRTNSRHMLYIRTSITNTYYKVICAFSAVRTCYSIIYTNHRCAQCIICLVATTKGHCSTAAVRVFYSST